jgi:hypothetical protein
VYSALQFAVGLNCGFAIYTVLFQHIYRESPFGELIERQPSRSA